MDNEELPPLQPDGDPSLKPQVNVQKGDVNPQLEPQAALGNMPQHPSEEDKESLVIGQTVQNRLRNLKKLQAKIKELEEKVEEGIELSLDQMTKVGRKATTDFLCSELEALVTQSKAKATDAEMQPSTSQRKSMQKLKREVNLVVKSSAKKDKEVSYSEMLYKATEDIIVLKFEAFCQTFTLQGDRKSYCTGVAKSMIVRLARTMVIEYAYLEEHDKDMAMAICRWPSKMLPRLSDYAKKFLYQIWSRDLKYASKDDIAAVKEMMRQFELQIVELPKSHKMLAAYMDQWPKVESCELDNMVFDRPTPSSDAMVSGILSEVVGKHIKGLAWNGNLGIGDMEVKDDSRFIITKLPLHSFDPSLEVSVEVAGWLKNDLAAVWNCICKKVQEAGNGPLPHYPALERKLTQTDIEVFCNPVKLYALQETVLHIPAAKSGLDRSLLLSGTHKCCRAYDMDDPAAPYKTLLFQKELKGSVWSEEIHGSENAVLTGVLDFNQEDGDEPLPTDGRTRFYIGPDGNFETLKEYLRYIQTHGHDPNGNTFGAYVDYSRHLSNHGTKYSKDKREFEPPREDREGALWFSLRGNQKGPRHQHVNDLGVFESAAAIWVEDALTDMINMLLEHNAFVGMLLPFWRRYQNCGKHPPEQE